MTDRIRVTMAVDLFIDDEHAMREKAFATLRAAWSSEDDFPYSSSSDVPLDQVVNSVLADALPLDLPGCRRGTLDVDSAAKQSDDSGDAGGEGEQDNADAEAPRDTGDADSTPDESDTAPSDRPEEQTRESGGGATAVHRPQ